MPQSKPIRNHVCRIAICMVLGAAMTVAAAWIVAVTVNHPRGAWSNPSGIGDGWSYWLGADVGLITVRRVRAYFHMQPPLKEDYRVVRRREVPSWSCVFTMPDETTPFGQMFVEEAAGWPLLALRCEPVAAIESGAFVTRWGIVARVDALQSTDRLVLPLRPIWSGFLFNTAFFAGIAFAIMYAPGIVRRSVRRREGRCESCGYDLRGSGAASSCPECGASAGKPAG